MKKRALVSVILAASLCIVSGCAFVDQPESPPALLTWSPAPKLDLGPDVEGAAAEPETDAFTPRASRTRFQATAYCIDGLTASGLHTKRWMVAADPQVLPMGSRIAVHNAGDYSGVYTVTDTGALIKGHKIDIFMGSEREAREFGRRDVEVELFNGPPAETLAEESRPRAGVSVR